MSCRPGAHRSRRATRLTIAAVLATAAVATACSGGDDAAPTMPSVELESLTDGATLHTDDIEGPALVNLWATWCAPCRAEMPAFQEAADELGDTVRIVGINQGDDGDAAQQFVDEIDVSFPQYLDRDGALLDELRIAGLPATIAIDAEGNIVTVHSGTIDADGIRDLAATLTG